LTLEKTCSNCNETKNVNNFYTRKVSADGYRGQCKTCDKRYKNTWYEQGKWRDYHYKKSYGITEKEAEDLLLTQGGLCAICSVEIKKLGRKGCVDHCHETGVVRGILCGKCNTALGKFGDDIEKLQKAINYLKGNTNEH